MLLFFFVCNFATTCLPSAAAVLDKPAWIEKEIKNRAARFAVVLDRPAWKDAQSTQRAAFQERASTGLKLPIVLEHTLSLMELSLQSKYAEALKCALERGANVNVTKAGQTPLYAAICECNTIGALLLLDAGSNVDHQATNGDTPLICAISTRSPMVVAKLLEKNASVRLANAEGRTPLHMTALYEYLEGAHLLLQAGACANAQDHEGNTPLHLIARASCVTDDSDDEDGLDTIGFHPLIILLIAHGADPNLKNAKGKSASQLIDESFKNIWESSLKFGEAQKQDRERRATTQFYKIDQSVPTMEAKCIALINEYVGLPT